MATLRRPRPFILVRPTGRASDSARSIREALGDDVCRLSRIDRIPRQYKHLINWGNSGEVESRARVWNRPEAVGRAINKRTAFDIWSRMEVRIPNFTCDSGALDRSRIYLARTTLHGSGGAGIVVVRPGDEVPDAPLYVQYIKKRVEYRVHVAFGEVIFAQQKKRKAAHEQSRDDRLVRNHDNGWVFCPVSPEELQEEVKNVAVDAVAGLELDFGAVDIVIGNADSLPYVLECNSCPGISSPGLIQAYKYAFLTQVARYARW